MRARRPSVLVALASGAVGILAAGCGTLNLARTLGAGRAEIHASVGGPIVELASFVAPIPAVTLGGRYGVSEDVDVVGHVSLDALGSGALAIDVGSVEQMVRAPRGFAMALSTRLHVVADLDDAVAPRLFPEVGLHLEQPLAPWATLFFGASGLAQLEAPRDRPFLFVAPYVGLELELASSRRDEVTTDRTDLSIQLAWINPWESRVSFLRYVPDGAGALSLVMALRHRFGGVTP